MSFRSALNTVFLTATCESFVGDQLLLSEKGNLILDEFTHNIKNLCTECLTHTDIRNYLLYLYCILE